MFEEKYYNSYTQGIQTWEATYSKRKYFYKTMAKSLLKIAPNAQNAIEIGCGLGFFSYTLGLYAPKLKIFSGDISDYAVRIAQEKLSSNSHITVQKIDAQSLDLKNNSTNILVAFDILEHLKNPQECLKKVFEALKPGGTFLMTTPNLESLGAKLKGKEERKIGVNYLDRIWEWHGYRDDSHINIRPISDWQKMCQQAGFVKIKDGSDTCWDTPYFHKIPIILQKLFFNGSHHIISRLSPVLPWKWGENYVGFWRKPI